MNVFIYWCFLPTLRCYWCVNVFIEDDAAFDAENFSVQSTAASQSVSTALCRCGRTTHVVVSAAAIAVLHAVPAGRRGALSGRAYRQHVRGGGSSLHGGVRRTLPLGHPPAATGDSVIRSRCTRTGYWTHHKPLRSFCHQPR